ncbi:MAG: hypothetical protein LLG06_14290 [Desulfobacteraceae bacterium]|nr:hypothetical protein [Desulfobacteraceae bacterium]
MGRPLLDLIASARHREAMESECIGTGLTTTEEYLSYLRISRPEASIDVSGTCSARCPSCPRGNTRNMRRNGCMSADVYGRVLGKLLDEMPHLMNIEFSAWSEPFLNPELAHIVRMTEERVPCTIHTNLQHAKFLEGVIEAQPSQLVISAGGYEKSYEENHPGAFWQAFLANTELLRNLLRRHRPKTQCTLLYHVYRDNGRRDLDAMCSLAAGLGFQIYATWAYLNPYDKILDLCEGREIGGAAAKVLEKLPWSLEKSLGLSRSEARKPCLCQRIFPIINSDLSVSLCHTYYNPVIAGNFLEIPLSDLVKIRHDQEQCRRCQAYGLHRLDLEVLLRKYPASMMFYECVPGRMNSC